MSQLSALRKTRRAPLPPRPSPSGRAAAPAAGGRVLVIDDDQSMCETLATVLTRRGFTVEWRTAAREGLGLLEGREFDVVVTDLHMDGMDGIAVCEELARSHPGLPVVVITAFGTAESAASALRVGAWGFVTKPFDLELLRTTLTQAVLKHRGDAT
jgi:two-component system, NtrC family, response regulator AtoC